MRSAPTHEEREHFEIERELADRLRNAASTEERRQLYPKVYDESRRRIKHHVFVEHAADEHARRKRVDPQVRLALSFMRSSMTFLEIGAGNGEVAQDIAAIASRATALDVTDALASPSALSNYEFVLFDGFDFPLEDESVDLAYSMDVIEHLHPDDALHHLREVRRVLRAGGRYVCVTPHRLTGPHDISRGFIKGDPVGFHLIEYTHTELAVAMRRAGFGEVKVLLSYRGRRLSPLLPSGWVRWVERAVERLSPRRRRWLTQPLGAIKVIGAV
jgi:SAM-dependent methyltransferase